MNKIIAIIKNFTKGLFKLVLASLGVASVAFVALHLTVIYKPDIQIFNKAYEKINQIIETKIISSNQGNQNFSEIKTISPIVPLSEGLVAFATNGGKTSSNTYATLDIQLINKGNKTMFLKLAGPTRAVDNTGGHYTQANPSGISECPYKDAVACIKHSDVLLGMTQLDPGKNLNMSFEFFCYNRTKGRILSFSTTLIGRSVNDLVQDITISDEKKKKQLRTYSLSVPSIEIPLQKMGDA